MFQKVKGHLRLLEMVLTDRLCMIFYQLSIITMLLFWIISIINRPSHNFPTPPVCGTTVKNVRKTPMEFHQGLFWQSYEQSLQLTVGLGFVSPFCMFFLFHIRQLYSWDGCFSCLTFSLFSHYLGLVSSVLSQDNGWENIL